MWNIKCVITPVVTGATGIVTKALKENLTVVPGKHSIDSLGTSHNNTRSSAEEKPVTGYIVIIMIIIQQNQ
jgi:hypothetical protein